MELSLSAELKAVAELARSLGVEKLAPAARPAEAAERIDDETWGALLDTGLTAVAATDDGGDGIIDAVTHVVTAEHLGYGDPGIALGSLWSGAAALLLSAHGTAAQAAGARQLREDPTARGSIALYEAFGRSPDEWTTTVTIEGDQLRVRGAKVGVPFVADAASIVVLGLDHATGAVRAVIVPTDTPGLTVEPVHGSLALGAVPTRELHLDVRLPVGQLVGAGRESEQRPLALDVERIRLLPAAVAVGTGQRAIDYASAYATDRVAFGRPIAGFQGVSFLLADKQMRIEAARLEILEAATTLDTAVRADEIDDVRRAVREAVNYATDAAAMATRDAVQVLGGHGFITDHPVELWYRSAAALASLDFDPLCSAFAPAV